MDELVSTIKCARCSLIKVPHKTSPHLCDDCVKVEESRISYYRQHNFNWIDVAKEADIPVWERQPAETDREWQVWLSYRDAYPGIQPSYRIVAQSLGTTLNVVKKVGQRWTFPARLQAWAKYCDGLTMRQRQQEILDMNKEHIEMATTLREKLKTAINKINPDSLEVRDIQGLFKLVTDIERKARIDNVVVTPVVIEDTNPELKKSPTKTEDLSTIIKILNGAGVLNNGSQLGIRQTTTTEVVVKDGESDDDL